MRQRLFALGIIAGVAVIGAVVVYVLVYGRLDPSPPSLRKHPEPAIPGEIVYVTADGCIRIVQASGEGEPQELICRSDIQGVTWLADGRVLYAAFPKGPNSSWWIIDPQTREQTNVTATIDWWTAFGETEYSSPDRSLSAVPYGREEAIAVIGADGQQRTIYESDGPEGYYPEFRTWSPDGRYLAFFYGRDQEIWLIAADGSVAGTLAGDVGWAFISWRIEGTGYLPKMRTAPGGLE